MAEDDIDILQQPPFVQIETKRLRLRTLQVSDAENVLPIVSKEEIMRWTSQGPATTLSQTQRWVRDRCLGQDVFNFGIELCASGEFIGVIGSFHWPTVGYIIDTEHAGQGFATEALRALIPALFERMPSVDDVGLGFDYIEAVTDAENKGSQRVLEKCGLVRCETHLQDFQSPMLGLRDTVVYRVPRPGQTLTQLGLLPSTDTKEHAGAHDPGLTPPIQ